MTSGTVVKRADALNTIKAQLKQQGLTQSESNGFVAYWKNKIPAEPYVRITWFNTAEMNGLAPLTITPKPDTLIRVFLDMDGLHRATKTASTASFKRSPQWLHGRRMGRLESVSFTVGS